MLFENLKGKTFILGVGAQKAGTSWLFDCLSQSPQVSVSAIKELHVFDTWFRPDLCARFDFLFTDELRRRLKRKSEAEPIVFDDRMKCLLARVKMIAERSAYLEYFSNIDVAHRSHFCEITPSYSLIGEGGWREVKEMFRQASMNLKIVFLLRDPIDRYYSALRMKQRKSRGEINANEVFLPNIRNPQQYERGRYDFTIKNLLNVFDEEDLYFAFYEELFSNEEIVKLFDFLGLEPVDADFSNIVNQSPFDEALSNEQIAKAREVFDPVYRFCDEFFGMNVPSSWRL